MDPTIWERWELLKELIDQDTIILALENYLTSDQLADLTDTIAKDYDINI